MQIINIIPLLALLSSMVDLGMPLASTAASAAPLPGVGLIGIEHAPRVEQGKRDGDDVGNGAAEDAQGVELDKRKGGGGEGGGGKGGGGGHTGPKGSGSSGVPSWDLIAPVVGGVAPDGKKGGGGKNGQDAPSMMDKAKDKLKDLTESLL